jgi:hypothetical protein
MCFTDPDRRCDGRFSRSSDLSSGVVPLYYCPSVNRSIYMEMGAMFCPLCGGRIEARA